MWPEYEEREARLIEAIDLIRQLWSGKEVTFEGKYYRNKIACNSANADDHIKFATQYIDLGFNQLFFHSAHPDQRAFLERYAHDVLPQLRQKSE